MSCLTPQHYRGTTSTSQEGLNAAGIPSLNKVHKINIVSDGMPNYFEMKECNQYKQLLERFGLMTNPKLAEFMEALKNDRSKDIQALCDKHDKTRWPSNKSTENYDPQVIQQKRAKSVDPNQKFAKVLSDIRQADVQEYKLYANVEFNQTVKSVPFRQMLNRDKQAIEQRQGGQEKPLTALERLAKDLKTTAQFRLSVSNMPNDSIGNKVVKQLGTHIPQKSVEKRNPVLGQSQEYKAPDQEFHHQFPQRKVYYKLLLQDGGQKVFNKRQFDNLDKFAQIEGLRFNNRFRRSINSQSNLEPKKQQVAQAKTPVSVSFGELKKEHSNNPLKTYNKMSNHDSTVTPITQRIIGSTMQNEKNIEEALAMESTSEQKVNVIGATGQKMHIQDFNASSQGDLEIAGDFGTSSLNKIQQMELITEPDVLKSQLAETEKLEGKQLFANVSSHQKLGQAKPGEYVFAENKSRSPVKTRSTLHLTQTSCDERAGGLFASSQAQLYPQMPFNSQPQTRPHTQQKKYRHPRGVGVTTTKSGVNLIKSQQQVVAHDTVMLLQSQHQIVNSQMEGGGAMTANHPDSTVMRHSSFNVSKYDRIMRESQLKGWNRAQLIDQGDRRGSRHEISGMAVPFLPETRTSMMLRQERRVMSSRRASTNQIGFYNGKARQGSDLQGQITAQGL